MSKQVKGNLKGLPPAGLRKVERLLTRKIPQEDIVGLDFAREISETAMDLSRMIGAFISREGKVVDVAVGTHHMLYLPELGRERLSSGRLRRLRLVFSDLSPDEETARIPRDIYADLEKLNLDMVAAVKSVGNRTLLAYAYSLPGAEGVQTVPVPDLGRFEFDFVSFIRDLEEQHARRSRKRHAGGKLRAVLVGVYANSGPAAALSLAELKDLAETAGLEVADEIVQRKIPDPKTLLGKGKLEEVLLTCQRLDADLVVFDNDLRPSQWRAVTNATELKVIDRSMLILDIFAQRAAGADGRVQVELAQLKYNLPRLVEFDSGLSRLTGGIGGRGPGETKLEIGRRRTRERIGRLEKEIKRLRGHRRLLRKRRQSRQVPVVAILGYTNAGKSTLFNALTGAAAVVEDKLFATLEPSQRRTYLPPARGEEAAAGQTIIFSDTVGFIRNLPSELVTAFRATLEELYEAALLVHVVDVSDPEFRERVAAVNDILKEMELDAMPRLIVLNKIDLLSAEELGLIRKETGGIPVSALGRKGLDALLAAVQAELFRVRSRGQHPAPSEASSPD
jgi:GTPase